MNRAARRLGGASHATRKAVDPFFARADLRPFIASYAGPHDPRGSYLSPLGADLRGLPPLLIHVGDHEVLLDDAVGLGERAREAGTEARRANDEIAAFIQSRLGLPV